MGGENRNFGTVASHLHYSPKINQRNNHQTILTIVNWEEYQQNDSELTKESTSNLTNHQPAINQPSTTYQECKKVRKKEDIDVDEDKSARDFSISADERESLVQRFAETSKAINEILMPITARPLDCSIVHQWFSAGADTALDILPTIRRLAAAATKPPRSLRYFHDAVLEAVAIRTTKPILPEVGAEKASSGKKPQSRHQDFEKQDYYKGLEGFHVVE
jgi:hypothetical protein